MRKTFNRDVLPDAFDQIGSAAGRGWHQAAHRRLRRLRADAGQEISASRPEDVDIAEIGQPWPVWLSDIVERIVLKCLFSGDTSIDAPRYPRMDR
jgi:hypothetical protein